MFNDIRIYRRDNAENIEKTISVPISYGPAQKFLARITQDPELNAPAITLPRMSFEITNMTYDGSRKLPASFRQSATIETDDGRYKTVLNGTPYNIDFDLSIMTKYEEDGSKILEQILPFFQPEWTPSVQILEDPDVTRDVAVVLNGVTKEDAYEGDFQQRRALIWTLNFTMKAWYFGPTTNKKIIKFVKVNKYDRFDTNEAFETTTVQPGLTIGGEPTTDINNTIEYQDINFDDNWDYIVTIQDST